MNIDGLSKINHLKNVESSPCSWIFSNGEMIQIKCITCVKDHKLIYVDINEVSEAIYETDIPRLFYRKKLFTSNNQHSLIFIEPEEWINFIYACKLYELNAYIYILHTTLTNTKKDLL